MVLPLASEGKLSYLAPNSDTRGSMENVVLTIHLLLALALVGVVLLQRSEGGGLGLGGGGGGSGYPPFAPGGAGGSGTVILKILTSNYSGTTTGSPTVTTDGSYTILQYNSDGSYTA